MSRKFSSAAKYLKDIFWDVRSKVDVSDFQSSLEAAVKQSSALAKKVDKATVEGDPHETRRRDGTVDPLHISGKLLSKSDKRITSYHAYGDGRVEFSQGRYDVAGASQASG